MYRIFQFLSTYRMYARNHSRIYAARIAYGMAFKGLPF